MYMLKQVAYQVIEVDPGELFSMSEASQELGISVVGVVRAIERGKLREVLDAERMGKQQGRRFVFREDVAQYKAERAGVGKQWKRARALWLKR